MMRKSLSKFYKPENFFSIKVATEIKKKYAYVALTDTLLEKKIVINK